MKLRKLIFGLSCLLLLASCTDSIAGAIDYVDDKKESNKQFDFEGNYTPPELKIDGLKDDEQWANSSEKLQFGSQNQTTMTIFRGNEALFCFFEVTDEDIQTVGFNNGDDVTHGDSVEVYFDFKNDASNKPQNDDIQINIGAHGKTRIFVGANGEWGSWNGLLDYEIRLNGTLNDSSDTDRGYQIELMIPYTQIGIDKDSVYGVSVGHVARGKDSTSETLQYTWGGMVYDGSFVDPQVPKSYVVFMGNKFYSRNNMPIGKVNLRGSIVDELGQPIEGVEVKAAGNTVLTNYSGKYELAVENADKIEDVVISKDGYKTYTYKPTKTELRTDSKNVDINLCLISNNSTKKVSVSGIVKNPVEGNVGNVDVSVAGVSTKTNSSGEFSITCDLDYDLVLEVSKQPYKSNSIVLDTFELIKNNTFNVGTVSLFSPASKTTFGGNKGIPAVTVEIYRGFDGIHFLFSSDTNIVNGDHVELFIDSKYSANGRDSSDYRIDFKGDGSIAIVNFGNGTNNVVSASKITNNAYLDGTIYYMDTVIPYSFLGIEQDDIIGVSFGVWSAQINDWDGWHYAGAGFEDYVAPEFANKYCRIGLENDLYRSSGNDVVVGKVYGKVLDINGNPVASATVNGKTVNADGSYAIYLDSSVDAVIEVKANGYLSKSVSITSQELTLGSKNINFELTQSLATITGTCNVEGAKVYLQSDPTIYAYVENGKYTINVPSDANARLIFEAEGYKNKTVAIGIAALLEAANSNVSVVRNVTLETN